MSFEYDSNLNYRVMDALRNFVQHRGFPLSGCKYIAKRINDADDSEPDLLYTIMPYLNLDQIKADKKFKKKVADEMQGLGDVIDMKPIIRGFISSIGNVHQKVRQVLKDDICVWENYWFEIIQRFKNEFGIKEENISLYAVVYDDYQ